MEDLKQRGLLEDTMVIWGGEFGRRLTSNRQIQFHIETFGAEVIPDETLVLEALLAEATVFA